MSHITIKINDKPHLEKCQFECDGGLHPKLDNYELTKFLNCHSTNLFCGRPASGKTSLMYSLMKSPKCLRRCFHTIYLFQPSNSRQSMKDKLFDKLPADQIFEELTFENLSEVMDRCRYDDPKHNSCIIFDDQGAYLKDNEILKLLKELMMNRRHLHISCFFLAQTFKSCPKEIRKLFTNVFLFKVSKDELKSIFEEVIERAKDDLLEISQIAFRKKYGYLFINTDSQRLFSGFDEILFD